MVDKIENQDSSFDAFKQILNMPILNVDEVKEEVTTPVVKAEEKPEKTKTKEVKAEVVEEEVFETTPTETSTHEGDGDFDLKVIAQHFAEKGVLSEFDPEEYAELNDEATLEAVIDRTVSAKVEAYKDSLGEDARYFLEFVENGGDPRDFISLLSAPDYSKLKIEDESNQKRVVKDYLQKTTKLSADQIDRKIERYIDNDLLATEAEDALEEMVKFQAKEKELTVQNQIKEQEEARAQYEAYKEQLKNNVYSKKEIAGFQVSEDQRAKLFNHMTKPVTKDGKTQLMLNSEKDPDIMLKFAYLDMIGWDIDKLTKIAETKVAKSLKEKLKSKDTMSKLSGTSDDKEDNFALFRKGVLGK